MTKIEL
jgi:hypothetical protein